jgi:hypothetical protein
MRRKNVLFLRVSDEANAWIKARVKASKIPANVLIEKLILSNKNKIINKTAA